MPAEYPRFGGPRGLTIEDVREVRRLKREYPGLPYIRLAKQFGVSEVMIYYIVKRKRWGWVADE